MWDTVFVAVLGFVSGLWVGFVAPLFWQDWADWRRRPRNIKSENPDDAADQQPEG